ncbi:MAG: ABC transporter ATP-binding protein/permease [Lachnospiraceae bacterium]|nr:ABC transporter ATP-binding protein/permease [Lachnospiraceae bacterium]
MSSTWKRFCRTMRVMGKRRFLYYGSILGMSVGMGMFSVLCSLLMKAVVDISQSGNYHTLFITLVWIVGAGVVSLLVYRSSAVVYNVEAKRVYGVLYEKILNLEMNLPYAYYEKHHSGEIMSKVSYDLGRMGDIYGSRFRRMMMPFLEVVVYLIPMLALSPYLTVCLVGVNVVMMLLNMLLAEPFRKVSHILSGLNASMTEKLSDILQGMEQVRMFAHGRETVQEYIALSRRYARKSNWRILISSGLESANRGFDLLCSLVFLGLGVFFVQRGYTTLGALAAIYTLYGSFSAQFLQMNRYIPELVAYLAYAQNIFDLLEEQREETNWYSHEACFETDKEVDDTGMVALDSVGFSYGENKVLDDYSIVIRRGECVALTGASGCGKSTVSKLLLGLYPLDKGDITVMGKSVRNMTNENLRQFFSYVPQEPYLFEGSVLENIRMGKRDASKEEVINAAKVANAHTFILNLERGYDTQVGERGNRLSGGQRQRIAIARAILKGAPILLMDEATSALDNESERLVNDAVRRLHGNKTILMIAHRASTIQMADRVCNMETL